MAKGLAVSADAARGMGLVNRVCERPEEVVRLAHDFAQTFTRHSLVPQNAIRRVIREGAELTLQEALVHESRIMDGISALSLPMR